VRAQWGLIAELAQSLRGTRTVRSKLAVLFSRPVVKGPSTPLRDDGEIGRPTSIYVLVHFIALAAFGAWLLLFREVRPLPVQIVSSLTLVAGLYTLGGVLDGRAHALRDERARLGGTAIAGAALATHSTVVSAALIALALGGIVASFSLTPHAEPAEPDPRR
jgi:hypothetical protein